MKLRILMTANWKSLQSLYPNAHGCGGETIRGMANIIDNLCKQVDVVKGVVTNMKTDVKQLKRKAPMEYSDVDMLAEVMKDPKNIMNAQLHSNFRKVASCLQNK